MIKFKPLNNTKVIYTLKGKTSVNFDNQINNLLNKVKNRAEFEISDNNYYRTINEYFQNSDKKINCRAVSLSISQDETNKAQHLIEISMLHPTMAIENKRPLAYGDKKAILNYLNKLNVKELIENDIKPMSERLKNI